MCTQQWLVQWIEFFLRVEKMNLISISSFQHCCQPPPTNDDGQRPRLSLGALCEGPVLQLVTHSHFQHVRFPWSRSCISCLLLFLLVALGRRFFRNLAMFDWQKGNVPDNLKDPGWVGPQIAATSRLVQLDWKTHNPADSRWNQLPNPRFTLSLSYLETMQHAALWWTG